MLKELGKNTSAYDLPIVRFKNFIPFDGLGNLRLIGPLHLSSYTMLSIKSLVKKLGVFERNKIPLELKVLAWHSTSSCQASRGLLRPSPRYRTSKTAVWKWIRKLGERMSIGPPIYLRGSWHWTRLALRLKGSSIGPTRRKRV
jgi:hypothetical protein